MPVIPPSAQFSGSGFGQFGSYWYLGGPSAASVAGVVANSASALKPKTDAEIANDFLQFNRIRVLLDFCCGRVQYRPTYRQNLPALRCNDNLRPVAIARARTRRGSARAHNSRFEGPSWSCSYSDAE